MSEARENILARIRARKTPQNTNDIRVRQKHCVPASLERTEDELFALFCENVKKSAATFELVDQLQALPKALEAYLSNHSVFTPSSGLHINCPSLIELAWPEQKIHHTNIDRATASITRAFCGIAETGSVALLAEPGHNSAAYFLPDILIVTLAKKDIVASQEACWAKLRADYENLPRTLTLATGPSRTGDIEQKLVIGAHGPRHEHLLIIND